MSAPDMRVAILGGNLLGCATAFYTRRVRPNARIEIFERRRQLGGNKFATVQNVVVGSAASADVASAPLFSALLNDAQVSLDAQKRRAEWALFDWKQDSIRLSRTHSRWIRKLLASNIAPALLQLVALCISLYFASAFYSRSSPFLRYAHRTGYYVHYPSILLFANAAALGFGLIPMRLMLRFWNYLLYVFRIRMVASITYGGESLAVLSSVISQMHQHLSTIQKHNAASSCVTLGHLLSACGFGKYVKQPATRYLSHFRLHPSILDDAIYPCFSQPYADSNVTPNMNALAMLLGMLSTAPIPSNLRGKPALLSPRDAQNVCPQLVASCSANVRLNTEVTEVVKTSSGWECFSVGDNAERESLGTFDAVILAAVIDPSRFSVSGLQEHLTESLALSAKLKETGAQKSDVNVARYTAIVKGALNASYFRMSSPNDLPTSVTVVNSVNCSEIQRIEPDTWRIVTGEEPSRTSNAIRLLFTSVESIFVYEHPKRPYSCAPLPELNDSHAPSLILGNRFLNAACVDRVANDINLDCLSAINVASFFDDEVATWKE
eukprot:gb/GEZJ01002082.1/.p1 GENE.gb/GEZJ01002082.1/~~gb/GEZJ01002082.1/.p1  ORF type:complete len:551 (+),score=54.55 gb/GEZJ01002082.1/:147-1799(+)